MNKIHTLIMTSCLLLVGAYVNAQSGSPDPTFDGDGIVTTSFGSSTDDKGRAVAIQNDGKIVVAGKSSGKFAIARFNTIGGLDTSFSADGKQTTNFTGSMFDEGKSLAFQTDGKIILAGITTNSSTNGDFAIVRYKTNGNLDNTFSGDGMQITAIGNNNDDRIRIGVRSPLYSCVFHCPLASDTEHTITLR